MARAEGFPSRIEGPRSALAGNDRPFHLAERWLTYRRRWAIGDLFFGQYGIQPPSPALLTTIGRPRASRGRTDLRGLGKASQSRAAISLPQLLIYGCLPAAGNAPAEPAHGTAD
jgi:hypothetical protein